MPDGPIDQSLPVEVGAEEAPDGARIRALGRTGQQKTPLGSEALESHALSSTRRPSPRIAHTRGVAARVTQETNPTKPSRRRFYSDDTGGSRCHPLRRFRPGLSRSATLAGLMRRMRYS